MTSSFSSARTAKLRPRTTTLGPRTTTLRTRTTTLRTRTTTPRPGTTSLGPRNDFAQTYNGISQAIHPRDTANYNSEQQPKQYQNGGNNNNNQPQSPADYQNNQQSSTGCGSLPASIYSSGLRTRSACLAVRPELSVPGKQLPIVSHSSPTRLRKQGYA